LLGQDLFRRGQIVGGFEFFGEVPLPLVSGIVASVAQQVANRLDLCGHTANPGEVRVVKHPRVLDMLPGVEHGTGRCAYAGIDPMVFEHDPFFHKAFVGWEMKVFRQFPRTKMALLIRQDEKDIVRSGGALAGFGWTWRLRGRSCCSLILHSSSPFCAVVCTTVDGRLSSHYLQFSGFTPVV